MTLPVVDLFHLIRQGLPREAGDVYFGGLTQKSVPPSCFFVHSSKPINQQETMWMVQWCGAPLGCHQPLCVFKTIIAEVHRVGCLPSCALSVFCQKKEVCLTIVWLISRNLHNFKRKNCFWEGYQKYWGGRKDWNIKRQIFRKLLEMATVCSWDWKLKWHENKLKCFTPSQLDLCS